jgi:WD40 repeat protein
MAADAKRFLLYNKQMIEEAPLQSYLSAILFAPTKSLIRSLYCGELPQWLSQRPVIRENWSQELLSLEGHADGVIGVSFSSDSRLLASASSDKTIRIWDVKTGRARSILKGHSGPVRAVAFSPNGRLLVSASADETLSLWDVETGGKRETLKGHSDTVYDVAFSPDARCIASVSADGKVKLWGVTDGRARVTPYSVPGTVKAIAFMRDGQRLACATAGGHVKLLDVTTGGIICDMLEGDSKLLAPLANYRYHKPEKWVTSAAFSPDGQLLASESKDKSVWLWDCRTRSVLGIFENHLQLKAVAISPNLRRLATAYSDRTIVLWDLTTGSPCNTLECHSVPNAVAFSPHGRLLASALQDKTVKLWDVTTDSAPRMVEGHPQTLTSAVFSPDGQFFAAVLRKNTVAVWDATTGAACGSLGGHSGSVTSVAFSPDNQLLAYASSDHTVRLWHHASETLLHVYHSAYVHWLKFSANGTSIETDNDLIPLHLPPRPAVVSNVHVPALRFAFEDNWLTCNSENLLWLPHEYRPETLVTHNNRIALVLRSHRIIFLAFDFGNGQELK